MVPDHRFLERFDVVLGTPDPSTVWDVRTTRVAIESWEPGGSGVLRC